MRRVYSFDIKSADKVVLNLDSMPVITLTRSNQCAVDDFISLVVRIISALNHVTK